MAGNGRMLRALVTWRELSRDPAWDDADPPAGRGSERASPSTADDYAYYPDGGFGEPFNYPRSGWLRTDEPQRNGGRRGIGRRLPGPPDPGPGALVRAERRRAGARPGPAHDALLHVAQVLGRRGGPRRDTAGLVDHVAARGPDPACVAGAEQAHWYSHFHARAIALRGMLEYATVARDEQVLEFVRRSYEYTWS